LTELKLEVLSQKAGKRLGRQKGSGEYMKNGMKTV